MTLDMLSTITPSRKAATVALAMLVLLLFSDATLAQEMPGGGGLPYEAGLGKLRQSMKGPVPFVISLVGIVACGAMLIFGGEISGFMRTMVFIVLVVSVLVQAESIIGLMQDGGSNRMTSAYAGQPRMIS